MYAYIKGQLQHADAQYAILEANGVGYKIFVPGNLFSKLPHMGESIILHTSFVVRELSQTLYGFLTVNERDLFEILLNISGIGPKTALSIIGHMSISDLQGAILSGDIYTLSKVPGIGKKTAERLVVEMKDKAAGILTPDPSALAVHSLCDPSSRQVRDALSALTNLGYNQTVAQKAIKKTLSDLPEGIDLATLITTALKHV
jgi:Holliday junction DNA helicase RuvA